MNLQKEILDNLNKSSYERLTKPNNIKSIFEIFKVFILITTVYFLLTINNIYCNIFSFIIVAGIQHRIYMIQHECTHYNLFNNKSLNSIIGSIFSYLIFFNWNYRFTHLKHHKSLGTIEDPDSHNYIKYPANRIYFLMDIISHLIGISAIKQFFHQSVQNDKTLKKNNTKEIIFLIGVQFIIFFIFNSINLLYYILFWIMPLLTLTKTLAHLRNIAEHIQLPDSFGSYSRYRTIYPNFLESFFLSPLNFNFHAEHHLFPKVCFHELPNLHAHIISNPNASKYIDVQIGYTSFLMKCIIFK